jgi:transposase InsO family protein
MSAKAVEAAILQSHIRIKQPLRHHLALSGIWCDFHFKQSNDIFSVIKQAVTYFNFQRPVSKLNYKAPVQFRLDRSA